MVNNYQEDLCKQLLSGTFLLCRFFSNFMSIQSSQTGKQIYDVIRLPAYKIKPAAFFLNGEDVPNPIELHLYLFGNRMICDLYYSFG